MGGSVMDTRGSVTPFRHRLLEIDLTSGTVTPLEIPAEWSPAFVGGRGLGARLLWERLDPGVDALAPEAEMYALTGPLTGVAPGGAQTSLVFKSPATRTTIGHAVTGGQWGPELRACGFDGLVIRGRAPSPVYVVVTDGAAEIRPAAELWGKTTFETEALVKAAVGGHGVRVLSIGPTGENLVRFASVQQEMFRSAARGGPEHLLLHRREAHEVLARGADAEHAHPVTAHRRLDQRLGLERRLTPQLRGRSDLGRPVGDDHVDGIRCP